MLPWFNQRREDDDMHKPTFSLGPPRYEVGFNDDFKYTISFRFESPINTSFANRSEKIELPMLSSSNISSKPNILEMSLMMSYLTHKFLLLNLMDLR